MNEIALRKLIREEIEAALDEADGAAASPPKSWHEFRTAIAELASDAGAPAEFVEEIADVSNEGEGVPVAVFNHWQNFQAEQPENPRDHWETFAYYAADAIRDAAEQYSSAMNYAPGHRNTRFNADQIADAVENAVTRKHVFTKRG